jgi:hypothetical protein
MHSNLLTVQLFVTCSYKYGRADSVKRCSTFDNITVNHLNWYNTSTDSWHKMSFSSYITFCVTPFVQLCACAHGKISWTTLGSLTIVAKMEFNIKDKVWNNTISCVQHLKTCITILRPLLYLKCRI